MLIIRKFLKYTKFSCGLWLKIQVIVTCNFIARKPKLPDIPKLWEDFPELLWDDVKSLLAYSNIRKAKAKIFILKRCKLHAQWGLRKLSKNSNVSRNETKKQNKTESTAKVVPWKRAKLSSDEIEGNYFINNFLH